MSIEQVTFTILHVCFKWVLFLFDNSVAKALTLAAPQLCALNKYIVDLVRESTAVIVT